MATALPDPHTPPVRIEPSDTRRAAWLGLAVALALAAASGAWALGQHRYGEMLNEWRWRGQLKDVKSVRAPAVDAARLALLLTQVPGRDTREGGVSCRFHSGCSAFPSA